MSLLSHLQCIRCGTEYPAGTVMNLCPLDNNPEDLPHIFNLGEGNTPLLDYNDHPLGQKVGFALLVKDEGKAHTGFGANPTQSFKDRSMAMTTSMAHKAGIVKLAVPTQVNAGSLEKHLPDLRHLL